MKRHGFSLVELSIVLVILGLLTGGVLGGQALIKASQLRSVQADLNRYVAAATAFRDKYGELPGDLNNAVKYWGAQAGTTTDGTDATCAALRGANPAVGTVTCNGDGDGHISNDDFTNSTRASWYEVWRAWQHMANAGLVEGSYTGVSDDATSYLAGAAGKNIPSSKISGALGFAFTWADAAGTTAATWLFPGTRGNYLRFGGGDRVDNGTIILRADEMWNLDTKMDDGRPGTGRMRPYLSSKKTGCSNSDDPAVSVYLLSDNTPNACNLLFKTGL